MRKKLFSAAALFALCASLFAIDSMFLRLKSGKIVEYQVEDVDEVFFGESTPVIDDTPGEEMIKEDTLVVDISESPFAISITTDTTASLVDLVSPESFDTVIIPSRVRCDGKIYTITQIQKMNPKLLKNTKYVEIPSSVTEILDYSFAGITDLDVVVKNSKDYVDIGECAFCGCKSVSFTKELLSEIL